MESQPQISEFRNNPAMFTHVPVFIASKAHKTYLD